MVKEVTLFFINLYQRTLSPDHSWLRAVLGTATCRFEPTCSQYTYQAVEKFGARRGLLMGLKRISRCHPWRVGGYDPLPTK